MKPIRPILREAAILYYRWASREIHPLHPDAPYVVHRLRDLLEERNATRCYLRQVKEWL